MSTFILDEISDLKEKIPSLKCTELLTCVVNMVQVKITKTHLKQLTILIQFPNNYPANPLLIELKSKGLDNRLLEKMTNICDDELKKHVGERQITFIVKFLINFLEDNPLCVCSEEIRKLKTILTEDDELKLKQKSSQILLKLKQKKYFIHAKFLIPDNYPIARTDVEIIDHNFPNILKLNFETQCKEIARKCVESPLKQKSQQPFIPTPCILKITKYLIEDIIKKYPYLNCPICGEKALSENPSNVVTDVNHDMFVERIYCGDLYHHKCLDSYMKTPPFTNGKKCLSCNSRIFHAKWKASPELAESRWAQREAKKRELAEVVDFLE